MSTEKDIISQRFSLKITLYKEISDLYWLVLKVKGRRNPTRGLQEPRVFHPLGLAAFHKSDSLLTLSHIYSFGRLVSPEDDFNSTMDVQQRQKVVNRG